MNAVFHQTISNDFANLTGLMEGATEFLESQDVDTRSVFRINLALEEMVTNIIKYGYDAPGRHMIEVSLAVGAEDVTLVIIDDGHDFNPALHESRHPDDDLHERETGGLGIHLVAKMLDRMDHRREEGRNILEIKTRRELK
jgi:anti-sigma regulatory factor (Ser/Thr protein kinase)